MHLSHSKENKLFQYSSFWELSHTSLLLLGLTLLVYKMELILLSQWFVRMQ